MKHYHVAYITNAGQPDNTATNTYHTIKPLQQEIERNKYDRYNVDVSVDMSKLERLWLANIIIPKIKNPSSTFGVTLERPMIDPHTYYLKAQKVFQLNHPTVEMVKHCKDMEEPVTFPRMVVGSIVSRDYSDGVHEWGEKLNSIFSEPYKGETTLLQQSIDRKTRQVNELMEAGAKRWNGSRPPQRYWLERHFAHISLSGLTPDSRASHYFEVLRRQRKAPYEDDEPKYEQKHKRADRTGPSDKWLKTTFGHLRDEELSMGHKGHFYESKRRERERDREIESEISMERERMKIARSMYGISDEPAERSSDVLDAIRYSTTGRFTGKVAGEDLEKGDAVYLTPDLKATREMILSLRQEDEVIDICDLGKREADVILRKMINGERA